jgi:hypothetical protein
MRSAIEQEDAGNCVHNYYIYWISDFWSSAATRYSSVGPDYKGFAWYLNAAFFDIGLEGRPFERRTSTRLSTVSNKVILYRVAAFPQL